MKLQVLTLISIICICSFVSQCKKKQEMKSSPDLPTNSKKSHVDSVKSEIPNVPSLPDQTAKQIANDLGMTSYFDTPEDFLAQITTIMNKGKNGNNAESIIRHLKNHSLTEKQSAALINLINSKGFMIDSANPYQKIGDLKPNKLSRWAINLKDSPPILLDVVRKQNGKWQVEKISIPQGSELTNKSISNFDTDALNYAHTFLGLLLRQDFKNAKKMVDTSNISDAKLAGLCIIFEDAAYQLNHEKPLRALYIRDTAAGFYANVVSSDSKNSAQFSIITQRKNPSDSWKIFEINLDNLLQEYANYVRGGDVHYTPLIKNPDGGDTLVIYFEFDSKELAPRTMKQLQIITRMLKIDPSKTITISGHTDAMGALNYNKNLSHQRAKSVKEFLISNGVNSNQVITKSYGSMKPRVSNTLYDGSDNPAGRRANRRTEIYLDF